MCTLDAGFAGAVSANILLQLQEFQLFLTDIQNLHEWCKVGLASMPLWGKQGKVGEKWLASVSGASMNKFLYCGIELNMLIHQRESISIKAKKTKANISHLSLQLPWFIPGIITKDSLRKEN